MADLHIVGGNQEEQNEKQQAPEEEKVPTVIAQAVKVIHPLFQNPQTGQLIPPPPDHEFRVGVQVSITTKGRVVQEDPGLFFVSGDSPEEIANRIQELVKDSLEGLQKANNVIQEATPEQRAALEKLGRGEQ